MFHVTFESVRDAGGNPRKVHAKTTHICGVRRMRRATISGRGRRALMRRSLSRSVFFQRVELFEVGLHTRVRRIERLRSEERLTCLGSRFRIACERGREVDPRTRELRIEAN